MNPHSDAGENGAVPCNEWVRRRTLSEWGFIGFIHYQDASGQSLNPINSGSDSMPPADCYPRNKNRRKVKKIKSLWGFWQNLIILTRQNFKAIKIFTAKQRFPRFNR